MEVPRIDGQRMKKVERESCGSDWWVRKVRMKGKKVAAAKKRKVAVMCIEEEERTVYEEIIRRHKQMNGGMWRNDGRKE